MTGRLVGAAGLAGVRVGDRTLPFWAGLPAGLEGYEGRDVVLGWRPEDVQDAASVDDPNVARLRGVVVATEFTGPSVLAFVELDAPPPIGEGVELWVPPGDRARLVARLPRDHPVQLGMFLTVAVDAARAHVFDPATGVAVLHPGDTEQEPSRPADVEGLR